MNSECETKRAAESGALVLRLCCVCTARTKGQTSKACELTCFPRWVPVGDCLPERSRTVLACYVNSAGMLRRIRAHWIPAP